MKNASLHDPCYWHPVFERAYGNFLRAYAAFLKRSPCRTSLLGVRQNFNAIEPELRRSFEQDFRMGRLCWFHASSEMEPRKGVSGQYEQFIADCRTGKTLAYAEPWHRFVDIQAAGRTFRAQCSASGRWKTMAWELSRPVFGKDDSSALCLRALGSDLMPHMVEVTRK